MTATRFVPAIALLLASCGTPADPPDNASTLDRTAELAFDVVEQGADEWVVAVSRDGAAAGTVRILGGISVRVDADESATEASLGDEALLWAYDGPSGHESASFSHAAFEAASRVDDPTALARSVASVGDYAGAGSREDRVAFTVAAIRGAAEAVGPATLGGDSMRLIDMATASAARELGLLAIADLPQPPAQSDSATAPRCENGCTAGFPGWGYCGACCDEDQTPDCGFDQYGSYCYCQDGGAEGGTVGGPDQRY